MRYFAVWEEVVGGGRRREEEVCVQAWEWCLVFNSSKRSFQWTLIRVSESAGRAESACMWHPVLSRTDSVADISESVELQGVLAVGRCSLWGLKVAVCKRARVWRRQNTRSCGSQCRAG